jgi:hypothetical protein
MTLPVFGRLISALLWPGVVGVELAPETFTLPPSTESGRGK